MFGDIISALGSSPAVLCIYRALKGDGVDLEAVRSGVSAALEQAPTAKNVIMASAALSLGKLMGAESLQEGYAAVFSEETDGAAIQDVMVDLDGLKSAQGDEVAPYCQELAGRIEKIQNPILAGYARKRLLDFALRSSRFSDIQALVRKLTEDVVAMGDAYQDVVLLCNEFKGEEV